jgi:hypothetical protein
MTYDEMIDEICAAVPMNNRTIAATAGKHAFQHISNLVPYIIVTSDETFATSEAVYDLNADFSISDFGRLLSVNRVDAIRSPIMELKEPETIIQMNASNNTGLLTAYAMEGSTKIRFYPWPEIGSQISFRYAARPDPTFSGSTEPTNVHPDFHHTVVFLAASRLAIRESPNKVTAIRQLYETEMAEYRKWMRTRQGDSFSALEVGYPGSFNGRYHRNDIYP